MSESPSQYAFENFTWWGRTPDMLLAPFYFEGMVSDRDCVQNKIDQSESHSDARLALLANDLGDKTPIQNGTEDYTISGS